jgi:hypothetical protein
MRVGVVAGVGAVAAVTSRLSHASRAAPRRGSCVVRGCADFVAFRVENRSITHDGSRRRRRQAM